MTYLCPLNPAVTLDEHPDLEKVERNAVLAALCKYELDRREQGGHVTSLRVARGATGRPRLAGTVAGCVWGIEL